MDRSKLLTLAVIALLILNLGTLAFLLLPKPYPHPEMGPGGPAGPRGPKPKTIIIEQLGLDAAQVKVYEGLIKEHRQAIDSLDQVIRESKDQLYQNLAATAGDQVDTVLVAKINAAQKQIELTHYNHFLAIKKLCKPEQMEKFNALTEELHRLFGRPPHPRHAP
ncbi:MAG: hypothetical protein RLZZ500_1037 [Bacteroidota bacterium]|jgi:Spy/CpxP family protein refolding chaperone